MGFTFGSDVSSILDVSVDLWQEGTVDAIQAVRIITEEYRDKKEDQERSFGKVPGGVVQEGLR